MSPGAGKKPTLLHLALSYFLSEMVTLLFFFPGWNSRINSTPGPVSSSSPSPLSISGRGSSMSESRQGACPEQFSPPPCLHRDGLCSFCLLVVIPGNQGICVTPATPVPAVSRLDRCWSLHPKLCVTYRFPSESRMAVPDAHPPTPPNPPPSWPPDRQPCSTPYW